MEGGEPSGSVEHDGQDPSIRLGPVPSSAFRPPSPRPETPQQQQQQQQQHPQLASKYEIVSIREKHGQFRKAVPCMPLAAALCCCVLNVLLPGTGTLVSGLTVLCGCRTELTSRSRALGYNALAALLQLITAPLIVGWIWSVFWGITFVNVSVTKDMVDPNAV